MPVRSLILFAGASVRVVRHRQRRCALYQFSVCVRYRCNVITVNTGEQDARRRLIFCVIRTLHT